MIDVREPDEYAAGHVPGRAVDAARHGPRPPRPVLDRRTDVRHLQIRWAQHAGLRVRCRRGLRRRQRHGRDRRLDRLRPRRRDRSQALRDVPLGRRRGRPPRSHRPADRRAEICPRHRVPSRAHLLPSAWPSSRSRWPGGIALVDPLAVNPELFKQAVRLRRRRRVARRPAGSRRARRTPSAACRGSSTTRRSPPGSSATRRRRWSSSSAASSGHSPAKGDRLTDWLHRPLTADQQEYAAADVRYLLDLQDHIDAKLIERGRLAWAVEAFDELRSRPTGRDGAGGCLGAAQGRPDAASPRAGDRPGGRRVA